MGLAGRSRILASGEYLILTPSSKQAVRSGNALATCPCVVPADVIRWPGGKVNSWQVQPRVRSNSR